MKETQINRLRYLLSMNGIGYETYFDEWPKYLDNIRKRHQNTEWRDQVVIRVHGEPVVRAVCQYGSYGSESGLIECYDFKSDPVGWMTAEEAFDFIIEHGGKVVE